MVVIGNKLKTNYMDIDEILTEYGLIGFPHRQYAKQAIKDIIQETLRMAADDAKVKTRTEVDIDGYPTTFSIVDKDSITNVITKIKF
jgi:hypothetical protein